MNIVNKNRKCKYCKIFSAVADGVIVPAGFFCSMDHALSWANHKQDADRQRQLKKANAKKRKEGKAKRAQQRKDREMVKRTSEWFAQLQILVNQYVLHVRDKNEPCCTCGTTNPIKYDAGHYRSRGACSELRFELTNIHKQCSVKCNQHGSGKRAEYIEFLREKYGQEHLDWLDGPHPSLKERFPHYTDIKAEITRYRKLLRDAGLKPYA